MTLGKFVMRMIPTTEVTLKTYDNLGNFLANICAILFNILLILMIILPYVNEIKDKNLLLDRCFHLKLSKI